MEEIKARRAEIERLKLANDSHEKEEANEKSEEENDKEDIVFVAVGRVFSGTLRKGDKIKAMGPKYTKGDENHCDEVELGSIYLLMGRDLLEVDEAPAGSIVGIGDIKGRLDFFSDSSSIFLSRIS